MGIDIKPVNDKDVLKMMHHIVGENEDFIRMVAIANAQRNPRVENAAKEVKFHLNNARSALTNLIALYK